MRTIRVAVIGVGNCASSLIQGVSLYANAQEGETVGLMNPVVGGYKPEHIKFVCGFDVDNDKVDQPLAEAIFKGQNNTIRLDHIGHGLTHVEEGAMVYRGPTLDGLGDTYREKIIESDGTDDIVSAVLNDHDVDIVVNYLPVGSEIATRHYAQEAVKAGCGFVNTIPVFLNRDNKFFHLFEDAKLPLIGDDIKSQFGATILHRAIMSLLIERGLKPLRTTQLNVGGNMDFYNMLAKDRLSTKRDSKAQSVTACVPGGMADRDVHIGPSDYVEWLGDRKWAFITIESEGFGGVPINVELKMDVWDSPNSAGVAIDGIRAAAIAMDRQQGGPINEISAWLMKTPPKQVHDAIALKNYLEYINASG